MILERYAIGPPDFDTRQCTCHPVEADCEDYGIEREGLAGCHLQARPRETLDGILPGINERHIGAVEGLEVVGVDTEAPSTDAVMLWRQGVRDLRIVNGF